MKTRIGTGVAALAGSTLLVLGLGAAPASAHNGTYYAVTETKASCQAAMDNAYRSYSNSGHSITTYNACRQNSQGGYFGTFYYYHQGDPV